MVYLLCFDKKFHHTKHYIGYCAEDGLTKRMARHKSGRGACIMKAVSDAGICFHVARTWPDADRNFERKLKNQRNHKRFCPDCGCESKCVEM